MSDDRTPYWKQTLVVAPAFAAKALIGDLPKGVVEHAVESRVGGSAKSLRSLVGEGLRGRGGGRAAGGIVGILTAPMYLRGLQMAGSKNKSERAEGVAMLGLGSSILATQKGGLEGYRHARVAGSAQSAAARKGLTLGLIRAGYKLPAALAVGLGVAAGQKKGKGRDGSSKYLIPALTGAGAGAVSRGAETVIPHIAEHGRGSIMNGLRKALPSMAGGAAGGLVGGLALAGAVSQASKMLDKPKHASVKTASLSAHLLAEAAGIGATHQAFKGMLGFGAIGRTFSKTPGLRSLQHATHDAEARHLAIGIREGLKGKADVGWRGALALGATMPEMIVQRRAGQSLGKMLRHVPEGRREQALEWLQHNIQKRPGLHRTPSGDTTPVFSVLPDAIERALGKKSLYKERTTRAGRALQRAYEHATLGGRGVLGKGLPAAGAAQRSSALRQHGPNVALGTAGTTLAVGAAMGSGGVLPMAAGTLGMHAGFGGIKGIASQLPLVKDIAKRGVGRGIVQGVMPGVKDTRLLPKVITGVGETVLTPALRDSERVVSSFSNAASRDISNKVSRTLAHRANRTTPLSQRLVMSKHQRDVAAMSALGGGAAAQARNFQDTRG